MNPEYKRQGKVFLKFVFVFIFAALYALGGIEYKELRRFVAPVILTGAMFWFSKDWRSLINLFMIPSLCLGYGGTDLTWLKILKRTIFGLANAITSSGYNLLRKKWLLFALQATILVASYVLLGVFSLIDSRAEEFVLGLLIALIPMLSVRSE